MAEQAQKEPTMEEILSSIRKIIADDDAPGAEENAQTEIEDDLGMFDEPASADDDASVVETEEDVLAAISQSMEEATSELDVTDSASEESFDFVVEEDNFETFEEDDFEGVEDFSKADDTFETAPEPEPLPPVKEEKPMTAKAAPLTDTATVTAAAGALSKLLSNVEFGEEAGGATTIEGLVREMLRPMLKEWLDENLPGIVEKHVEAEVQRIARMAG
ncbi:MAG: DUF2497 domain-containing protein [Pseudomonadota bacterium]